MYEHMFICDMSGSHGCDYKNDRLLEYITSRVVQT
jgi:hypothetical protein